MPVGTVFPHATQHLQERRLQEAAALHYTAMLCSLGGRPPCRHDRCGARQMKKHVAAHAALPQQLLHPAYDDQ
jgi:hypothetical protein